MNTRTPKPLLALSWILRLGVAGLFVMLAIQKFHYVPMTEVIFGDIGGRPAALGSAAMELIAAVLLVVPRTVAFGAMIAVGSMIGAIGVHLAVIGIELTDPDTGELDGGSLFGMALGVLVASSVVLWVHRSQLLRLVTKTAQSRGK